MASTTVKPTVPSDVTEKTFTGYNSTQAETYNSLRRNYHSSVYDFIVDYHKRDGGKLDTAVDVGCGPGLVTRSLAARFTKAIGVDPSPALLDVAKAHPDNPSNISFVASSASTFCPDPIPSSSTSVITVGNAAHWFPSMHTFYARASEALEPGGTLAIWTSGHIHAAHDLPNSAAVEAAMQHHADVVLKGYINVANLLVRNGYRDLPLPWDDVGGEEGLSNDFDKESFVRREWTAGEKFMEMAPGEENGLPLDLFGKMLGTGSGVTRWRQAHPDLANTDKDCVNILCAKIGQLLRDAGVKPGEERVWGVVSGVVLLFKKKAT